MASTPFVVEERSRLHGRWKKRQSLVTLKTIEWVLKVCDKTRMKPRMVAKMADVGHTTIARMIEGTAEPGEETLRKLHAALEAIEQTLLSQERPSVPEVSSMVSAQKDGR